jgi:hypothetical protein
MRMNTFAIRKLRAQEISEYQKHYMESPDSRNDDTRLNLKLILLSFLAAGLLSQVTVSCNKDSLDAGASNSQLSSNDFASAGARDSDIAVLYLGGFSSCSLVENQGYPDNVEPLTPTGDRHGMSMIRWISPFNKAFGKPHRSLIACYPFWTNLPKDGNLGSVNTDSPQLPFPGHLNAMDTNIYLRHNFSGALIPTQKIVLRQFLASLEADLTSQGIRRVAILGHSYGGYTAMLIAKALSVPGSRIKVTSLTTLDPISMDTCQPANLIETLPKNIVPPGCQQAPATGLPDSNISAAEVKNLAGAIPWTNLWQGADKYLHSSPINAPGIVNREVVYSREKSYGVANHVLFVFTQDSVNPEWPKIAASAIQQVVKNLQTKENR